MLAAGSQIRPGPQLQPALQIVWESAPGLGPAAVKSPGSSIPGILLHCLISPKFIRKQEESRRALGKSQLHQAAGWRNLLELVWRRVLSACSPSHTHEITVTSLVLCWLPRQ